MSEEEKKHNVNEISIGDENQQKNDGIFDQVIEDEMRQSFLDYSMSVIVARALPDVRDGLKPVHRRILHAMNELGLQPSKKFRKSAAVVGEVLGKYHPHGDSAVYDAMVRMAQPWALRYPLVFGQGNFGSQDGDNAAAMRYTEAKMHKFTEDLLADIKKDTVEWSENFDATLKEPAVLPSKVPNLLLNGSTGIAVGMATNIAPHNMIEIIEAIKAVINNPEITISDLFKYVPGPDFPTGGIITGRSGIYSAYTTGHGKIKLRSKTHFEEVRNRQAIIIDELPYTVNKALLLEEIASQVRNEKIEGIHDLRDESDRKGIRVVIELKKDASQEVVLNKLLKHSRMSITFGYNNLVLVNGKPRVLTLKETITNFIDHRFEVITRRTQFELNKAQSRAHILEGLLIALANIDDVVHTIKESENSGMAQEQLIAKFELSKEQSKAILEMKLSRLTSMETDGIKKEHGDLMNIINDLQGILADKQKVFDIIVEDLNDIKERYGDERRTAIIDIEDDIDVEDLIEREEVVVTMSHEGYVKRMPLSLYREQNRGGRGVSASATKDDDFIENIFVSNTHDYLLTFTTKGKVHWLKVYQIPEGTRQAKGKPMINFVPLEDGEKIATTLAVKDFKEDFLVFATKNGTIKKSSLMDYSRPRNGGIIALSLNEGDELIKVVMTDGNNELLIATKKGNAVRFNENDVRQMGRTSTGVRGIKLSSGDELVGIDIATIGENILTITENGYGKQTPIDDYRLIKRGGSGVKNIKCSERNGDVITSLSVQPNDSMMIITKSGVMIRTSVDNISTVGRNTQGVRIMKLDEGDKVISIALIRESEETESESISEELGNSEVESSTEEETTTENVEETEQKEE